MSTGRSGQTRRSSSAAPSSTAPRPPQPRCPAPVGLEDPGCPRPRGRSRACRPSEAVSGAHPRLWLRTAPDGTGGSWPWLHGWHVACGAWRNRFRPCSSGTRPPAICLASSWANEKTRPLRVALRGQLGGLAASPTEGAAAGAAGTCLLARPKAGPAEAPTRTAPSLPGGQIRNLKTDKTHV